MYPSSGSTCFLRSLRERTPAHSQQWNVCSPLVRRREGPDQCEQLVECSFAYLISCRLSGRLLRTESWIAAEVTFNGFQLFVLDPEILYIPERFTALGV